MLISIPIAQCGYVRHACSNTHVGGSFYVMVYVGEREYKYGRMIMSHMAASTLDELHKMAESVGVAKIHFQDKVGKPHYDICKQNKLKAIELGAIEVDDRKIIELYRSLVK